MQISFTVIASITNWFLVALSGAQMDSLFALVKAEPSMDIIVDLPAQTVTAGDEVFHFDILAHHKNNLIKGLDAIGQTLELNSAIEGYETKQPAWL